MPAILFLCHNRAKLNEMLPLVIPEKIRPVYRNISGNFPVNQNGIGIILIRPIPVPIPSLEIQPEGFACKSVKAPAKGRIIPVAFYHFIFFHFLSYTPCALKRTYQSIVWNFTSELILLMNKESGKPDSRNGAPQRGARILNPKKLPFRWQYRKRLRKR